MAYRNAILVCVLLTVIVAGLVFFGTKRQPQPSYQGRSARAWLDQVFGPPPPGTSFQHNQQAALEAFRAMGTNAHPFLLAALGAKETLPQKDFRLIFRRLPPKIQGWLPRPTDVPGLRSAADLVLLNVQPKPPVAELLALADSGARRQVFELATVCIRPSDANQTPLLASTCRDTDAVVRECAAICLGRIGPAASNALPALAALCTDPNSGVRGSAAVALYNVKGQSNEEVPVLKGLLAQAKEERQLYGTAIGLVMMKDSEGLATTTFIGLLTNSPHSWIRGGSCQWLGIIGRSATNAVPTLRQLLHDPDAKVRQMAVDALARIQSEGATNAAQ